MKKLKNIFSNKDKTPPRNSFLEQDQNEFNELSPNSKAAYANSKKMAAEINRGFHELQIKEVYGSPARKSSTSDSKNSSLTTTANSMYFFPSADSSSSSTLPPGLGPSPTRQSDPWGGVSPTGRP